ncbi:MAG: hypothetical protein WD426_08090 [Anditalea sp.]
MKQPKEASYTPGEYLENPASNLGEPNWQKSGQAILMTPDRKTHEKQWNLEN